MSPQDVTRFWSKVDKSGECWLWQGRRSAGGYGNFWLTGRTRLAHRVSYETAVGPIPEGYQIDHLCRVRNCVRPGHLEPTTPQVNTLRGLTPAAANAAKTHCAQGHAFDELNTRYSRRSGRVTRVCRACVRTREKASRQEKATRTNGVAA